MVEQALKECLAQEYKDHKDQMVFKEVAAFKEVKDLWVQDLKEYKDPQEDQVGLETLALKEQLAAQVHKEFQGFKEHKEYRE